jgi:hypothetical protein
MVKYLDTIVSDRAVGTATELIKELLPMQLLTQGQWWSNISIQLLQTEQWEQRGGR